MARIEAKAEMTGSVWKINKNPGDTVEEGDVLMILESMKMEIPVVAEESGTVKEILVQEGQPVSEGLTVAILES